ncbi:MAG: metallophosphoesterase [Candidatus Aenigmarchaeota archaeon]|nr:metallophosphoesterase [Candidatus Aenigmarchaeota archaeon]
MLISAISDIHSPLYFDLFVKAMNKYNENPDLFILAGDIIDAGKTEEFQKVYNVLFGKINCPIIAVYGNNEYQQIRMILENKFSDITFLDDESIVLDIKGKKVGIVGSQGSLDRPTFWQRNNIPNIYDIYKQRIQKVSELLENLECDFKILVIHYVPTYKILKGENEKYYPQLGSKAYESVIRKTHPDLVICGHSHNGIKETWVNTTPVFNAAIPVNKEIVNIDTEKLKPGLEKFF